MAKLGACTFLRPIYMFLFLMQQLCVGTNTPDLCVKMLNTMYLADRL